MPVVEVVDAGAGGLDALVAGGLGASMVTGTGGKLVMLVAVGADLPAALRSLMISKILSMACR